MQTRKTNPIKAQLAAEYIECIGHDPFADDPAITVEEVRQTLREWYEEARRERA